MAVSGHFEVLQINCDLSGTATVSGAKAAADTYSPGDSLDASFDACAHGFESLYGSMVFSISGFSETPDGLFAVSGNVVETGLTRVHGGTCFWFPLAPPVVTRESSGVLTGTDISGTFACQSIVPDEFLIDKDVTTGLHSGVLLVTAADNSSMRMVAVGEFNVRLDLDYNGDSVIDESISTTWAALGYDDMVCPQN